MIQGKKLEDKNLSEVLDMEVVLYFGFHIENPCKVIFSGGERDIRDFYIREAKKILPKLNPTARAYLENVINSYNPLCSL